MPSLPVLYVDVDGVLAFQPEGSILAVNAAFGESYLVAEATSYPWRATLPANQAEWLDEHQAVIAANLAPDTEAIRVIGKAHQAGYPVAVATERDPELEALTRAWLAYWAVPFDTLHVTGPDSKAALIADREPGDCILIDDAPKFEAIAGDGIQVWAPPRPWAPAGQAPAGVWRCGSWRDVKKRLNL